MEKKYLLTKEVMELMRYNSRSAFIAFLRRNETFPKPVLLGTKRKAYVTTEVQEWIESHRVSHVC
ncbi:helix-turn-helix transcriptional regulator [Thorsellia kenyensis]|uniref:Helix-turn-helix transcriptional regulator n=1 Tax=Thorsellia kenyensis TaxID=1549888 RepID=A0ABV6CBB5_9GAMM